MIGMGGGGFSKAIQAAAKRRAQFGAKGKPRSGGPMTMAAPKKRAAPAAPGGGTSAIAMAAARRLMGRRR